MFQRNLHIFLEFISRQGAAWALIPTPFHHTVYSLVQPTGFTGWSLLLIILDPCLKYVKGCHSIDKQFSIDSFLMIGKMVITGFTQISSSSSSWLSCLHLATIQVEVSAHDVITLM